MEALAELIWTGIVRLFEWWGWHADRKGRRRFAPPHERCMKCGYDLRGSLAAAEKVCPECGRRIGGWQVREWRDRHPPA